MSRRNKPTDATEGHTLAARFLRSAQLCRARDLKLLSILSDLVKGISELIHALQKERGASSIYLGSNGAHFADRLGARGAQSPSPEARGCRTRAPILRIGGSRASPKAAAWRHGFATTSSIWSRSTIR